MTSYRMRPAKDVDPVVIVRLHECDHVSGLLEIPETSDVIRRCERASSKDFVAFDACDRPIGLLLLDHSHSWLAEISRIIAARESVGIGSFLMQWALRYVFADLRVHRVFLEVHERNVRARRLYERFGFVREGTYRDGFRNPETGEFENLCPYGLLASDYRPS